MKTPVSESFFNKISDLKPTTLLKKRLQHKCFPVIFVKVLRTTFYRTHPVAAPANTKKISANVLSFFYSKVLLTTDF